jgi:hypothetical protein
VVGGRPDGNPRRREERVLDSESDSKRETAVKAGRKCTPQRRSKMHPLRVCGRERGEARRAERSEWPRARSSRWGAVSTLFAGLRPRSARPAAI